MFITMSQSIVICVFTSIGASMAIESFQHSRHSLVSIIGSTIVRPGEKVFKVKAFRAVKHAILILIFANTVNTVCFLSTVVQALCGHPLFKITSC